MINTPKELIARSDDGSVVPFDMAPGKKVRELGGMTNYIKAVNFKGGKLGNVENLNINGMAGRQRDVRLLVIKKKKIRFSACALKQTQRIWRPWLLASGAPHSASNV
jgi:hypothetical protein